ncbi:MAG: MotE family protein [Janthinobacterium lividum]
MKLRVPHSRLLPVTITALGALLAVKTVELVQFAVGSAVVDTSVVAAAAAATAAAEASLAPPAKTEAAHPAAAAAEPHGAAGTEAAAAVPAHGPAGAPAQAGTEPAPPALIAHVAPSADPAPPPVGDAERALLQDLRARKLELDARDRATSEREAVLSAAEHKLSERVEQLAALQTRLEALDSERKAHDEANWTGLVRTYEVMKPRDAAAIFNDLDLAVLLPVLDRMKDAKAALVLAAMQPERARLVTAKLAQMRNQPSQVAAGG